MRATQLVTLPELPASLRQLKASPPLARCTRFALLQRFNMLLAHIAPLVHTGPAAQGPDTLGGRICRLRGLIFLEVKQGMLHRYAAATVTDADIVAVQLNRLRAVSKPVADGSHTVFAQLHDQLSRVRPRVLCRHDKACRVNFVGEASDDHGGPYREAICHLCTELQSEQLPLFIRCPNGQHAVGNGRDAYLPNPSATAPQVRWRTARPAAYGLPLRATPTFPLPTSQHLERFHFIGMLLGLALRQKETQLSLNLPAVVWKQLVSEVNPLPARAVTPGAPHPCRTHPAGHACPGQRPPPRTDRRPPP